MSESSNNTGNNNTSVNAGVGNSAAGSGATVRPGGYAARQRARAPKYKWIYAAAACAVIIAVAVLWLTRRDAPGPRPDEPDVTAEVSRPETFIQGVSVNGTRLGGLTYEEAESVLKASVDEAAAREIVLTFQDRSWAFTLNDIGLTNDINSKLEAAWSYGHTGTDEDKAADAETLSASSVDLHITYDYDHSALKTLLEGVKSEVDADPVDATMSIVEVAKFAYTDSYDGYELDIQKVVRDVEPMILKAEGGSLTLSPAVIPPTVTRASLEEQTVLLGECTTSLEGSSAARVNNVNLALSAFNFFVVGPDKTVSFNKVVGERTTEAGFQEATEYAGTNVARGIGGGVCQASTTIYGAVIRAGLEILERYNHTMTVSYVPASQDAAVSNNDKDLRFKNNTGNNLYFFAWVDPDKNTAICRVFGQPQDASVIISIDSVILQADMPSTAVTYRDDTEGKTVYYRDDPPVLYKQGKPGMISQAFRVYTSAIDGTEIRRETLSTDTYAPENSIYLRGTHSR